MNLGSVFVTSECNQILNNIEEQPRIQGQGAMTRPPSNSVEMPATVEVAWRRED